MTQESRNGNRPILVISLETPHSAHCHNALCLRPRDQFPMAFRSDPYCSDDCRKAIGMDLEK